MSAETSRYRHTITGKVVDLTEDQASVFPDYLQPVAEDAKPFAPGMFRPGKVGEFDNPQPPTDEQEEAQRLYDSLIAEGVSPNTKIVREAKSALDAANKKADDELEAARVAAEEAEAERIRLEQLAASPDSSDQAGQTGDSPTESEGK